MTIRLLLVDDSPLMRELLRAALAPYPDITVVGEAGDGIRAQQLVRELQPDVVTMDLVMPMMGGLESIERIMAEQPTPVLVVADPLGDARALAMEALERGALEVYLKPTSGFDERAARELVLAIRRASRVRLGTRERARSAGSRAAVAGLGPRAARVECVGIVGSTGSPQTLRAALAALPRSYGCALAVVQHTAVGFTETLVSWLRAGSALDVVSARDARRLEPGQVVVAPDDAHLEVGSGGIARLRRGPPVDGHRPSGTVLLSSIARAYGPRAAGVVLSGMGRDGADGLAAIEAAQGVALVESPDGAVVGGMPRQALAAARSAVTVSGRALASVLAQLGRRRER